MEMFKKHQIFSAIFMIVLGGWLVWIGIAPNVENFDTTTFAVVLEESNQTVFSDKDIDSYNPSTKTFTLTQEGAEKMKSYQPSTQINSGLFEKSFIAKLGNEELYKGTFTTALSSRIEPGITLGDVVIISPEYNTLTVSSGFPADNAEQDEKINNPKLLEHFQTINKLQQ